MYYNSIGFFLSATDSFLPGEEKKGEEGPFQSDRQSSLGSTERKKESIRRKGRERKRREGRGLKFPNRMQEMTSFWYS